MSNVYFIPFFKSFHPVSLVGYSNDSQKTVVKTSFNYSYITLYVQL